MGFLFDVLASSGQIDKPGSRQEERAEKYRETVRTGRCGRVKDPAFL